MPKPTEMGPTAKAGTKTHWPAADILNTSAAVFGLGDGDVEHRGDEG